MGRKINREISEMLKEKARKLANEGYSLREIAALIGRSHQWVALSLKESAKVDKEETKIV